MAHDRNANGECNTTFTKGHNIYKDLKKLGFILNLFFFLKHLDVNYRCKSDDVCTKFHSDYPTYCREDGFIQIHM